MNLNDIKEKYGEKTNLEDVRKQIKREMRECHPDKFNNDGKFPDKNMAKKYYELSEMLDILNGDEKNNALQVIEIRNEIIKQQLEIIKMQSINEEVILKDKLASSVEKRMSYVKGIGKAPKISLGVVNAVMGALFLFPEQVSNHPILGVYISKYFKIFSLLWLYLIIITVAYFVYLAINQQKSIEIINQCQSEQFQERVFISFMKRNGLNYEFDKFDLEDCIVDHLPINYRRNKQNIGLRGILFNIDLIDSDILNDTSSILIQKAINKGIIEEVKTKTLTDTYKFKLEIKEESYF